MKILIANWVYDWGSTGFIARDLKEVLSKWGHQVIVATSQNKGREDPGVHVITKHSEWKWHFRLHRLGTPKFSGSSKASKRLIKLIKDEKPDVVNLHLLHGNHLNLYYLLREMGKMGVKTVVTNHAELYYTGSCGHAYDCDKWIYNQCRGCKSIKEATGSYILGYPHLNWLLIKKAFSSFNQKNLLFTAVSPWVKERFDKSPIVNGFDCEVVLNGLDSTKFYPREKELIYKRVGTNDFLLHVSANFNPILKEDVKGSYYLVKLAETMPEQKIVVVATSVNNIEKLPDNMLVWGKAKDQDELAALYSAARLTVLVSRRETFSMVTAESLCCGTPVVGFKAGGPESISLTEYSSFVEQGDVEALADAIRRMTGKEFDRKAISEEARNKYSSESMAKGYLDVYEEVLKR